MDWLRHNSFVATLAALTILLSFAGGYFLFIALANFEGAESSFEDEKNKLQSLEQNAPFPNEEHLEAATAQLTEASRILEEIAQSVRVPVPESSPQQFQDDLRRDVDAIRQHAEANGVGLGEDFYLGFEKYQTKPPTAAAASSLTLQLSAIRSVANILIEAQVREIQSFKRQPLPAEIPAAKEPRDRARNSRSRKKSAASDPKGVAASALVLAPFQVTFVADQAPFRVAFNQIIAADPAVFIRSVEVTNSSLQGPSKSGAQTTTVESSPEMEGDPVEAQLKPILGQELLTISLRLSAVASGESSKEEN